LDTDKHEFGLIIKGKIGAQNNTGFRVRIDGKTVEIDKIENN